MTPSTALPSVTVTSRTSGPPPASAKSSAAMWFFSTGRC
jgi:hypothetical protein